MSDTSISLHCLLTFSHIYHCVIPYGMSGGVLAWLFGWSDVQICIWPSGCHCHSLSLASVKSRLFFTFLVQAHLCSPGQRAVKRVCVYVIPYGMQVPVAVWQPCKLIFVHFSPLKDFGILFLNYYVLSLLIFTNVSTTCKVYLRVSPIICKIVILKAT